MSLRGIFRDSWDVWRRKVDVALGGSVEDIKASEVLYSGTSSGLEADNVQSAIDEVKSDIPTGFPATDITYDGTTSGLSATDVQGAIDEVKGDIPTGFNATAISYDNTTSGLTATDAQGAIDEVISKLNDNGFAYVGIFKAQVAADTTKPLSEVLGRIATLFASKLEELEADEVVIPAVLHIVGWSTMYAEANVYDNATTEFAVRANHIGTTDTKMAITSAQCSTTAANNVAGIANILASSCSYADKTADNQPYNGISYLSYYKFKRISV